MLVVVLVCNIGCGGVGGGGGGEGKGYFTSCSSDDNGVVSSSADDFKQFELVLSRTNCQTSNIG